MSVLKGLSIFEKDVNGDITPWSYPSLINDSDSIDVLNQDVY